MYLEMSWQQSRERYFGYFVTSNVKRHCTTYDCGTLT